MKMWGVESLLQGVETNPRMFSFLAGGKKKTSLKRIVKYGTAFLLPLLPSAGKETCSGEQEEQDELEQKLFHRGVVPMVSEEHLLHRALGFVSLPARGGDVPQSWPCWFPSPRALVALMGPSYPWRWWPGAEITSGGHHQCKRPVVLL